MADTPSARASISRGLRTPRRTSEDLDWHLQCQGARGERLTIDGGAHFLAARTPSLPILEQGKEYVLPGFRLRLQLSCARHEARKFHDPAWRGVVKHGAIAQHIKHILLIELR